MEKKIIRVAFVLVVVLAGFALGFIVFGDKKDGALSATEQKAQIQRDRELFVDWYEDYKHNLEQLDFCWQQYHRIRRDYLSEEIDGETAAERLKTLRQKQVLIIEDIHREIPPQTLTPKFYEKVVPLYKKLTLYSTAQGNAVASSLALLNGENLERFEDAELARKLEETAVAESPAALFTAGDIAAVRSHLELPGEK